MLVPILLAFALVAGVVLVAFASSKRGALGDLALQERIRQLAGELGGEMTGDWTFSAAIGGRGFSCDAWGWSRNAAAQVSLEIRLDDERREPPEGQAGYRDHAPRRLSARPRLTLRRATRIDKLGRALGINPCISSGDPELDRELYVDGGDASDPLVDAVLADPRMGRATMRAFELGCSTLALHASADTLRATGVAPTAAELGTENVREIVAQLDAIRAALPLFEGEIVEAPPVARSGLRMAGVASSTVLATAGIIGYIGASLVRNRAFGFGVLAGLGLSIPVMIPIVRAFRGRSASFRTVLGALPIVLFGSIGLALGALPIYNRAADIGPAVVHRVRVVSRGTSYSRNGGRSHYVIVHGWDGLGNLQLPPLVRNYDQMTEGSVVAVTTRPGALGWEWIEQATPSWGAADGEQ